MDTPADLGSFVGRFHLVLLHLPIGFLAVLVVIELAAFRPRWRGASAATPLVLAITVAGSWLTAGLGWLLAGAEGYEGSLLQWHRWTGLSAAVLTVPLCVAHLKDKRRVYRLLLGVTVGVTGTAGHFGGSLTHGRGFLTEHAPEWVRPFVSRSKPAGGGIQVLDTYCVSCHGEEKQKGGLRLDSREAILAGGDSGRAVVPGDPDASPLLRRVSLPLEHDDHMPPEGKPQPTAKEVQRLREWINAGALR